MNVNSLYSALRERVVFHYWDILGDIRNLVQIVWTVLLVVLLLLLPVPINGNGALAIWLMICVAIYFSFMAIGQCVLWFSPRYRKHLPHDFTIESNKNHALETFAMEDDLARLLFFSLGSFSRLHGICGQGGTNSPLDELSENVKTNMLILLSAARLQNTLAEQIKKKEASALERILSKRITTDMREFQRTLVQLCKARKKSRTQQDAMTGAVRQHLNRLDELSKRLNRHVLDYQRGSLQDAMRSQAGATSTRRSLVKTLVEPMLVLLSCLPGAFGTTLLAYSLGAAEFEGRDWFAIGYCAFLILVSVLMLAHRIRYLRYRVHFGEESLEVRHGWMHR